MKDTKVIEVQGAAAPCVFELELLVEILRTLTSKWSDSPCLS